MSRDISPELQQIFEIAATATVCEATEIPRDYVARMTLAATRGHGGYTLYQDREGRWFRVNSEPLP
jgi:hypothetical protein